MTAKQFRILVAHLDVRHPTLAGRGDMTPTDLALAHDTAHRAYPCDHDVADIDDAVDWLLAVRRFGMARANELYP